MKKQFLFLQSHSQSSFRTPKAVIFLLSEQSLIIWIAKLIIFPLAMYQNIRYDCAMYKNTILNTIKNTFSGFIRTFIPNPQDTKDYEIYKMIHISIKNQQWDKFDIFKSFINRQSADDVKTIFQNFMSAWLNYEISKTTGEPENQSCQFYNKIIDKFQEALKIIPGNFYFIHVIAYYTAINARNMGGHESKTLYDQAFNRIQEAHEIQPENDQVLWLWAKTLYEYGLLMNDNRSEHIYREASLKFEKVLQLSDQQSSVLTDWAQYLVERGYTKNDPKAISLLYEACDKYESALEKEPENHAILSYWGTALFRVAEKTDGAEKQEALKKGIELLKRYEQTSPGSGAYNLACFYSVLGNKQEALKWLEIDFKKEDNYLDEAINDPDLELIRNSGELQELIARFTKERST